MPAEKRTITQAYNSYSSRIPCVLSRRLGATRKFIARRRRWRCRDFSKLGYSITRADRIHQSVRETVFENRSILRESFSGKAPCAQTSFNASATDRRLSLGKSGRTLKTSRATLKTTRVSDYTRYRCHFRYLCSDGAYGGVRFNLISAVDLGTFVRLCRAKYQSAHVIESVTASKSARGGGGGGDHYVTRVARRRSTFVSQSFA